MARSVLDTARKILPGLNSKALTAELNLVDCKILRASGDLEKAESLLGETHRMAVNNNMTALEADVLFEQGLLFKDKGEFEIAISKLDAAANLYRENGVDKGFKEAIQTLEYLKRRAYA